MTATVTFFSVGNGDMTLITLESGKRILIDCRIRDARDGDFADVLSQLRPKLLRDAKGRHYVDAFLLSHPDEDHCLGLEENFYLGAPSDYPNESAKIFIREIWSSPIVFRRKSKLHTLCADASAFNCEARRRALLNKTNGCRVADGDKILMLGEDETADKTVGLEPVLVKVDQVFSRIAGEDDRTFEARLLAPLPKSTDAEEAVLTKNESSTILQFKIAGGFNTDACKFLTGGDAGFGIWERLYDRHRDNKQNLEYDILLTPHHCSWHSLSEDSISNSRNPKVSPKAKAALAGARYRAYLVASSKQIEDDEDDPPSYAAAKEYESIANTALGKFMETTDLEPEPLEFTISNQGVSEPIRKERGVGSRNAAIGQSFLSHG